MLDKSTQHLNKKNKYSRDVLFLKQNSRAICVSLNPKMYALGDNAPRK